MASFTELETWKQAKKIRIRILELTKTFPSDEKYRLADQIIRSSRSVGNNLAEGHGPLPLSGQRAFLYYSKRFSVRNP
jgi:four helix bundle protein